MKLEDNDMESLARQVESPDRWWFAENESGAYSLGCGDNEIGMVHSRQDALLASMAPTLIAENQALRQKMEELLYINVELSTLLMAAPEPKATYDWVQEITLWWHTAREKLGVSTTPKSDNSSH